MARKYCFMNKERVCDLTCKAAFEVDDPVDNVDCYFIWFSYQFGESLIDMRRMMELSMGGPGDPSSGGPMGGFGGPMSPGGGPKDPKGFSNN